MLFAYQLYETESFLFSLKDTDTGGTDTLLGTVEQQQLEKSMETKSMQGIVFNLCSQYIFGA